MRKVKKIGIAAALLATFFLFSSAKAVIISPTRQTIVVKPGEARTVKVLVENNEQKKIIFTPEVDSFSVDSKTGAAIFGAGDEAVEWVAAEPKELALASGEKGEFVFDIAVPVGQEAYSHYLALSAKESAGAGQIGVGSRAGSLLFLHVAGTVHEELVRQKFVTDKKFYFNPPIVLSVELKNAGTIHVVPAGEIVLKDKNGTAIGSFPLNNANRKVLPGESWQAKYSIQEEVLQGYSGKVEIESVINFGQSQKQIVIKNNFWLIPSWLPMASGSALLVLIVIFLSLKIFVLRRKD
jgi:hypothetical protein